MIRKVLLLVEGLTEEKFVKGLLGPALEKRGVALVPTIIRTKVVPGAKPYKGGIVAYAEFARQVRLLLGDSSAACVTTLLDYYGLPHDYPGRIQPAGTTPQERVRHVQLAMKRDVAHERYHPFLFLHEFEALLFVAPAEIARAAQIHGAEAKLREVRAAFPRSPEDINDSTDTAPSKRIKSVCGQAYQKAVHGPIIASRIGLEAIRKECPHFNGWIRMLEQL